MTIIASVLGAPRKVFARHNFIGGNFFMQPRRRGDPQGRGARGGVCAVRVLYGELGSRAGDDSRGGVLLYDDHADGSEAAACECFDSIMAGGPC